MTGSEWGRHARLVRLWCRRRLEVRSFRLVFAAQACACSAQLAGPGWGGDEASSRRSHRSSTTTTIDPGESARGGERRPCGTAPSQGGIDVCAPAAADGGMAPAGCVSARRQSADASLRRCGPSGRCWSPARSLAPACVHRLQGPTRPAEGGLGVLGTRRVCLPGRALGACWARAGASPARRRRTRPLPGFPARCLDSAR